MLLVVLIIAILMNKAIASYAEMKNYGNSAGAIWAAVDAGNMNEHFKNKLKV